MTNHGVNLIERIEFTDPFKKQYKKLPPDILVMVDEALLDLVKTPIPKRLRFEKLTCCRKPNIYTIHVTQNHSYKISFEIEGGIAKLRRVATHKEIDRKP